MTSQLGRLALEQKHQYKKGSSKHLKKMLLTKLPYTIFLAPNTCSRIKMAARICFNQQMLH